MHFVVGGLACVKTADDKMHVFSWTSDGGMVDLGTPPGTENAFLRAANISGQVAGSASKDGSETGFSWTQRTGFVDLGNLGSSAGIGISPNGINAVGKVTGLGTTSNGDQHAFLWDPRGTRLKDLGALGAGGWSAGWAISASGQVVGYSNPPGVDGPDAVPEPRHLLDETDGMIDLGIIGGVSSQAVAVNEAGQIAGRSEVNDQRDTHAVVWQFAELERCSATVQRAPLFHMNRTHFLMGHGARSGPIRRSRSPCSRSAHPGGIATWSKAGQLDWWVTERQEWWGRVRGADGRQRWIRAVDLRPASDSQP